MGWFGCWDGSGFDLARSGALGVLLMCLAEDALTVCFEGSGWFVLSGDGMDWLRMSWVCSLWGFSSEGEFCDEPESLILAQSERWRHA